jgi:hypothetical protein
LLAAVIPPPAFAQNQGGISAEEYHRFRPPVPIAVQAEAREGQATIRWRPPPPPGPTVRPSYDPAIALYRVYRVASDQSATLIGETPSTSFTDTAAPRGTTQRYAVTAVQRSGQESGRSDIVEVRIP